MEMRKWIPRDIAADNVRTVSDTVELLKTLPCRDPRRPWSWHGWDVESRLPVSLFALVVRILQTTTEYIGR